MAMPGAYLLHATYGAEGVSGGTCLSFEEGTLRIPMYR